jgi:hypothetical protein
MLAGPVKPVEAPQRHSPALKPGIPQVKSSEKYQVPSKKLTTLPSHTFSPQADRPAADIRVYLQLWDFVLRSCILILL